MALPLEGRLLVERAGDPARADTLASDVLAGLTKTPKRLPSKHFYDEVGSALFEEICTLPEYYPTRTEAGLLERFAGAIIEQARPSHLVELGSGSSRKTRLLLDAVGRSGRPATYVALDISESQLEATARSLLLEYPWLRVHARVADFEQPLVGLPRGPGVLAAFLGGTIGNFEAKAARQFLSRVASALGHGGWLLLGTDRVKDPLRLERAYDDSRGVTAQFNLNVLRVINRRLRADFDLDRFEHWAFYDRKREQIEMHLRSRCDQAVQVRALDLTVRFRRGETVRTEISRKFTVASATRMLAESGFRVVGHFAPADEAYSLWLARVGPAAQPPLDERALASYPTDR